MPREVLKGRRQLPCWPLFLLPSDCPPWLTSLPHPCSLRLFTSSQGLLGMQVSLISFCPSFSSSRFQREKEERSNHLGCRVRQLKSPFPGQAVGGPGHSPSWLAVQWVGPPCPMSHGKKCQLPLSSRHGWRVPATRDSGCVRLLWTLLGVRAGLRG